MREIINGATRILVGTRRWATAISSVRWRPHASGCTGIGLMSLQALSLLRRNQTGCWRPSRAGAPPAVGQCAIQTARRSYQANPPGQEFLHHAVLDLAGLDEPVLQRGDIGI